MVYDVDFFIQKFSDIPENMWCVMSRFKSHTGQRCALGWCYDSDIDALRSELGYQNAQDKALYKIFETIKEYPAAVNNGLVESYQQPTPRLRILAALNDIKNKQLEQELEKIDLSEIAPSLQIPPVMFSRSEVLEIVDEGLKQK